MPLFCEACREPIPLPLDLDQIVTIGPRGRRDIHQLATQDHHEGLWQCYHVACAQREFDHAPEHPHCSRPHQPCTDWHLRGQCHRGFTCGHCHLPHPELFIRYPESADFRERHFPFEQEYALPSTPPGPTSNEMWARTFGRRMMELHPMQGTPEEVLAVQEHRASSYWSLLVRFPRAIATALTASWIRWLWPRTYQP